MVDHAVREHAQWSASATDRNWNCSGALAVTDNIGDRTNEAADWGTCAHQIAEKCLRHGTQADEHIGTTEKGKSHSFEVDEEMAETAQLYVDYVRKTVIEAAPPKTNPADLLHIEQHFSLADLNPPYQAGGTADAVIYKPTIQELEVVDLKGGRGVVVEAKGNPQLRTYALGAMLANKGLKVKTVKVTIIQPRAPHKDGRIRSETFHVTDLLEWTVDLVDVMHRSKAAWEEYKLVLDGTMTLAAWEVKWLKAGPHCKFCKRAGKCSAQEQAALDVAQVWFDDLDIPRIGNLPEQADPAKISQTLDLLDMLSEWINAFRAHAQDQAESGIEIPNYILVAKEGREKWLDGKEQEAADKALAAGLANDKVWNKPKARTPKQIRDALIKAKQSAVASELESLSGAESKGNNLVRATKTSRSAVAPAVEKHFSILE
jgi:hypothetical protein